MQHFTRDFALSLTAVALIQLSVGPSHATEQASWADVKQAIIHQGPDGTTYLTRTMGRTVLLFRL